MRVFSVEFCEAPEEGEVYGIYSTYEKALECVLTHFPTDHGWEWVDIYTDEETGRECRWERGYNYVQINEYEVE